METRKRASIQIRLSKVTPKQKDIQVIKIQPDQSQKPSFLVKQQPETEKESSIETSLISSKKCDTVSTALCQSSVHKNPTELEPLAQVKQQQSSPQQSKQSQLKTTSPNNPSKFSSDITQFRFPKDSFYQKPLTTPQQFLRDFYSLKQKSPHYMTFKLKRRQRYPIQLNCRLCNSQIKLRINLKTKELSYLRFDNLHWHRNSYCNMKKYENEVKKILRQEEDKEFVKIQEHKNVNCPEYPRLKLKNIQAYLRNKDKVLVVSYEGFKEMMIRSLKHQSEVIALKEGNTFIMYPEVKQHLRFTDVIIFQERAEIVNNFDLILKEKVSIGIFSGISNANKSIIFSTCVIPSETVETYYEVIKKFFQIYHQAVGSAFYFKHNQLVTQALGLLAKQGVFRGTTVQSQKESDFFMGEFREVNSLLLLKNSQLFDKSYQSLSQKALPNPKIEHFHKQSFAYAPELFRGLPEWVYKSYTLGIGFNKNPKLSDVIKKILDRANLISIKISKPPNIYPKKLQTLLSNPSLKPPRLALPQKIFSHFCQNLFSGLKSDLFPESSTSFNIVNPTTTFKVFLFDDYLHCQCKYTVKAGLPCEHILKVMWHVGLTNYLDYVNSRWLLESPVQEEVQGGKMEGEEGRTEVKEMKEGEGEEEFRRFKKKREVKRQKRIKRLAKFSRYKVMNWEIWDNLFEKDYA